jgi:hypothetical protein
VVARIYDGQRSQQQTKQASQPCSTSNEANLIIKKQHIIVTSPQKRVYKNAVPEGCKVEMGQIQGGEI